MLFSIVKNPAQSAEELNHDLDIIRQWAHQWKMEFNPDPTKQATEVLFSTKRKKVNHPSIFFNGVVVQKVNEQKHLGLTLDTNLSFKNHINEKIKKAQRTIGSMKFLSKFLPIKVLDQMYKTLVRSHFDYCDISYHSPAVFGQLGMTLTSLMEKIEKVQYKAALAITRNLAGYKSLKIVRGIRMGIIVRQALGSKTDTDT